MRLRQKYQISGKPPTMSKAIILIDRLNREARKDVDSLTDYLSERGDNIGSHRIPLDKFDYSGSNIPNGNTYYHMHNGLTVRVYVSTYGKDWLIEKERKHFPKEVDVIVDIFGNGSAKLRQEIRRGVFGKESRKVVKD